MKSRSEEQIRELIIDTASNDPAIRAVVLQGSRAYHSASDPFSDFDVIYGVTNLTPYRNNLEWIKQFGELMILQRPDDMGATPAPDYKYTYLMQFLDGNRIDLNLYTIDFLRTFSFSSESIVLLDKDSRFKLPPPSDLDYTPKPPTNKQFFDCCNEFWWVTPYVAKGLWRDDLAYARHMLDSILRAEALRVLTWYFGIRSSFKKNPGKYGKHFRRYIEGEICDVFDSTYNAQSIESTWIALESMGHVFSRVAQAVASYCQYFYPLQEDKQITEYVAHVKRLPKGAKAIYE